MSTFATRPYVRRGADSGGDKAFPEEEGINKLGMNVRNNSPGYCSAKQTNSGESVNNCVTSGTELGVLRRYVGASPIKLQKYIK